VNDGDIDISEMQMVDFHSWGFDICEINHKGCMKSMY
jgi:hypothetical protein